MRELTERENGSSVEAEQAEWDRQEAYRKGFEAGGRLERERANWLEEEYARLSELYRVDAEKLADEMEHSLALEANLAALREAVECMAARFGLCAEYIDGSWNASGTLRAERSDYARRCAAEARALLAEARDGE